MILVCQQLKMKLNFLALTLASANNGKSSNGKEPRVGNPDQIIEDQLYWCCRDGMSLGSCVKSVKSKLDLYTIGNFGCSITNTMPAYSWKTYEGYNDRHSLSKLYVLRCNLLPVEYQEGRFL